MAQNSDVRSDVKWLRPPDSTDAEANKVSIAFECCSSQCLAMCDDAEYDFEPSPANPSK